MAGAKRLLQYAVLLALPLTAVTGCSHPAARQLEGRWFGETVENFSEDEIAVATGWARGASFEFAGSTFTVTLPAEDPRSGRFEVVSANDRDVVLSVAASPAEPQKRIELTVLEGGMLRWHLDELRSILMRHE